MRRRTVLGALLVMLSPVAAQAMTVDEFLNKAAALKAKGMAAMLSPDIGLLRDEVKAAGESYRAEIEAARAAGTAPRACPPPKGQAKVDSDTLLASFRTIPPARRTMSVKTAFFSFMDKRYPCP